MHLLNCSIYSWLGVIDGSIVTRSGYQPVQMALLIVDVLNAKHENNLEQPI